MKKRKLIFLLPIAAMALGACGKKDNGGSSDPGEQEHEDEVTLAIKDKANFELEVEATKQLEAELKGTTGTLVWASSAEGVARVDQTGKVTAVAVGSATISVTFGDHVDSVVVTVKETGEEVVHVQSISGRPANYQIEVGGTTNMSITVTPETASNKAVTYSGYDEEIISISADGVIEGLKAGSTNIVVTSEDNSEATFTVNNFTVVAPAVALPNSTSNGLEKVMSGDLVDGNYVEFIASTNGKIYGMQTYSSGNNIKATELTVESDVITDTSGVGLFVVVKNGDGTYSFQDSNGKYLDAAGKNSSNYLKVSDSIKASSKFNVVINDGVASIVCADEETSRNTMALNYNNGTPLVACYASDKVSSYSLLSIFTKTPAQTAVTGVEFLKNSYTVEVGGSVEVAAKVLPVDATDKEIAYSLKDVEPAGSMAIEGNVITATGVGTAKVVATSHDGEKTAEVTVEAVAPINYGSESAPLSLADAMTIINEQCKVDGDITSKEIWCTARISDKGKSESYGFSNVKVTDGTNEIIVYSITVSSELKSLFEVGKILTFHGFAKNYKGTLEFASNGSNYVYATSIVEEIVYVTGVTLDKETLSMEAGSAPQTLVATIAPENATNKAVIWSSSKEEVATVIDGVVTPVGVGETTITVETADGNKTASCVVTVTAATKTLTSISVEGPTKVEYTAGETLNLEGLVVTAHYDDLSSEVISAGYTTSIALEKALEVTDTSLVISYNGIDSDPITLTVTEAQPIVAEGNYYITVTKEGIKYYFKAATNVAAPTATTNEDEATKFFFDLQDGTTDQYIIREVGSERVLYCIDDNNGVRVGKQDEPTVWTISEGSLKDKGGSFDLTCNDTAGNKRWITLYNTSGFRCYKSNNTNRSENTDLEVAVVKTLDSISVTSQPTKDSYYVGETFDVTGLIVKGHYTWEGGSEDKEITGYTLSHEGVFAAEDVGAKEITVTFEGKTTTFNVTVEERTATLVSVTIEGTAKTEYFEGDTYSREGLTATAHYSDESTLDVTTLAEWSISKETAALGDEPIIIEATYEGTTGSKVVNVTIKEASQLEEHTQVISAGALNGATSTENQSVSFGDISCVLSAGIKNQSTNTATKAFVTSTTDGALFVPNGGTIVGTAPGKIIKFEVFANKGASTSAKAGVIFSNEPISEYNGESANSLEQALNPVDSVYDYSSVLSSNAKYFVLKNTSSKNAQIQIRVTYLA